MATIKLVLDQRRIRKDNTFPLLLRITHNTKSFPVSLGHSISTKYWSVANNKIKPSYPLYKEVIDLISEKERDIQKVILKLEQRGQGFSVSDVQQLLVSKNLEGLSFNGYAQLCIEQMKVAGRIGNALSYQQAVASLKSFSGKELQFHDITYKYLTEYDTHMRSKGVKVNAISCYLRGIRAIFNKAINEDVTSVDCYPFRKFRLKTEATASRAISQEKLTKLFALKLEPETYLWHYQNYFVLMFCLIGINFADLCTLTKENLSGGRLNYRRKKTKRLYSILLHPLALKIIQYYEGQSQKYLLPILPDAELPPFVLKKTIMDKLKQMNKALNKLSVIADIKEHLSTYTARYSWANIAKELGTPKEVIAEALGHSYGNAVTGIYLDNFDKKVMDAANMVVIKRVTSGMKTE